MEAVWTSSPTWGIRFMCLLSSHCFVSPTRSVDRPSGSRRCATHVHGRQTLFALTSPAMVARRHHPSITCFALMILGPREKIHVIHRQLYEADARRHFIGTVVVAASRGPGH